ncbi:hypothetical protein BS47DRAFT_1368754 [Hydnum rufescens UP504]|uniref:Uncharacterized protein n=1 Tax=Hydnum rufescens UP504 TaxID=1448309 RepID=A0A9P6AEK8_9AGAM|nr:hypothetical protein BS47DRAFT_1368754 [Hydnum rufescens UP504]
MAMSQDKMAKEAQFLGEHDIHTAIFMALGWSYSALVLQHNKAIFSTPEARAWFLNILGASTPSMGTSPDSGVEEDHNILHVIFQDFYISMACLHKELDQLKEASADIGVDSYKLKFPWRTFWHVLYTNNICLKNWVDPKESQNALSFNSTLKEDWCLLLHCFKIDGEESKNPVLEERIYNSTGSNQASIVLAEDTNGISVITSDMVPMIFEGRASNKSRLKASKALPIPVPSPASMQPTLVPSPSPESTPGLALVPCTSALALAMPTPGLTPSFGHMPGPTLGSMAGLMPSASMAAPAPSFISIPGPPLACMAGLASSASMAVPTPGLTLATNLFSMQSSLGLAAHQGSQIASNLFSNGLGLLSEPDLSPFNYQASDAISNSLSNNCGSMSLSTVPFWDNLNLSDSWRFFNKG